MKEIEILSALEGLGWKCDKDEAGDYFCLMDIGEVQIRIIPTIGKRSDHFKVSLMSSASTKNFTAIVASASGEASSYVSIIVSSYMPEKTVDFLLDDAARLSQSTISWASAQDIKKDLAAYRTLPTNSKDTMPLRHLTTLAVAGGASCLANYQFNFKQGNRLGLVPYIAQNVIERTLLIA